MKNNPFDDYCEDDYRDFKYYEDLFLPQKRYDWCIIQKCKYSEPQLVSCRLPTKDSITVTEYGFGEYTYSIGLDKVIMFGEKKELRSKLAIFNEISALAQGIKDKI